MSEPPNVAPAPLPKPERLGAYELLIELASGGMATVHLARATDRRQGPPLVAVKRPHRHLQGDKTFLTMLVDEARLASAIDHPNVVKVRELGFDGGMPFIVMDYVEGTSLAELRRELSAIGRAIDVRVAVRIILDALMGLHAAHELKDDNGKALHIIHRDVSPHNVLIGCDGRAYVTDFGIAKAEDRIQTTRTHEVKGKLAYLAPERIDKRRMCTVQSDVFSMAVVLWECFAGRRLFRGDEPVDVLQDVMTAPIPTLKQIGAQIPSGARRRHRPRPLSRPRDALCDRPRLRAGHRSRCGTGAHGHARGRGPPDGGHVRRADGPAAGARPRCHRADRAHRPSARVGAPRARPCLVCRRPHRGSSWPSSRRRRRPAATRSEPSFAQRSRSCGPSVSHGSGSARSPAGSRSGVGVTLAVVASRPKPGPIVIRGSAPAVTPAEILVAPTARKVVVPLPFLATHVELDDAVRDLDPPGDVAAFDVPAEAGMRHRVSVLAIDGTRADGFVREQDGIARPEADGYAFVAPEATTPEPRPPPPVRPVRPLGTVHNGFTKLR